MAVAATGRESVSVAGTAGVCDAVTLTMSALRVFFGLGFKAHSTPLFVHATTSVTLRIAYCASPRRDASRGGARSFAPAARAAQTQDDAQADRQKVQVQSALARGHKYRTSICIRLSLRDPRPSFLRVRVRAQCCMLLSIVLSPYVHTHTGVRACCLDVSSLLSLVPYLVQSPVTSVQSC